MIYTSTTRSVRNSAGSFKGVVNFFAGPSVEIVRGKLREGISNGFAT
jgi:hypothetical protein